MRNHLAHQMAKPDGGTPTVKTLLDEIGRYCTIGRGEAMAGRGRDDMEIDNVNPNNGSGGNGNGGGKGSSQVPGYQQPWSTGYSGYNQWYGPQWTPYGKGGTGGEDWGGKQRKGE